MQHASLGLERAMTKGPLQTLQTLQSDCSAFVDFFFTLEESEVG